MISSISISQIKYVLELAETGSFSKAAEHCFVTQSTLSTMIRKLEDKMDLKLFDRSKKPIRVTDEGQVLIGQLKVIYNEYGKLEELLQQTKEEFYGTLNIGIIPTVAPFLLPLFLEGLIEKYPQVNFGIHEITTNEIVARIKTRTLDIGILSLPVSEKDLVQKGLYLEDFLIYDASKQSVSKKTYQINDIDINRLWLLEESHCLTSQIEKICHLKRKSRISGNLIYNSGSILSLLELVNMNKGITLLPRLATLKKNLIDKRFIHDIQKPIPVREIGLITHANFAKKRLLHLLEEEIVQAIKPILNPPKKVKIIKPY